MEEKEEEGSAVLEKEEEGRRRESERSVKSGLTRFREESNPPAISEEGSAAEVEADDVEEVLVRYRKWLQENDVAGLTVAQMGAYMVLQLKKSSTNLGKYLLRMVTEPPGEEGQERQRSVLPLPLIPDSAKELKKVWDGEEYRRLMGSWSEKKKMNPGQVQRGMRRSGLLIWHGLLVAGINYLWSGCRWTSRICSRKPSQAQQGCLDRLWKTARLFVDDVSEVKEKLVKSPGAADWKDKLEGVRISYQGEIVEKAQELTLEQILPGLPPVGYGGRVSITDLCEGEVRECLLDPSRVLLEGEELPELLPTPKVMASDEEWGKICRVLMERGLIRPVDEVAKLGDQYVENGAFGVVKPHKKTESGKDVLRLIMDFRPCNAVTRIIEGDVRSLAGAPSLQHIVLPQGTVLRVSAEDLVAAFYLFALPPEWSKLMAFQKKVAWKDLGFEKPGTTRVGACVLPMGWASAVGVLQHAHRRLALASPLRGAGLLGELEIKRDAEFPELETDGGAGWSLYLDDTSILEILSERVAKEVDGKSPVEQDRLRRAYTHWGIPYSVDKALTRARSAEKLGAVIDGDAGQLRASTRRALEGISLGVQLCSKEYPVKKLAQVYAGKQVHTLQFRRPLFCIFDLLWKGIGEGEATVKMTRGIIEEVLLAGCLEGMKFTDLRAELNGVVTASDACETGGGTVYANQLSARGLSDVIALEEDKGVEDQIGNDPDEVVVVVDFFAGIGGLSRALELAKVPVAHLVVVEKDPDCRRLHRRRWPSCTLVPDITKFTKKQLEKELKRVPEVTGIIAAGGSPCQGISKLSSQRLHLSDPRSILFYDMAEKFTWLLELSLEMNVWCLRFAENVIGDKGDVEEVSRHLNMTPIEVCASDLSWVRRPRLYWCGVPMHDHESFVREEGPVADRVRFVGQKEPLEHVLEKGWEWPGQQLDADARLPTFTRAIPRSRPPPQPAGIRQCDQATVDLWRENHMMFPPYTFKPEFLMREVSTGKKRVVNADERESLMGYRKGYTKALFKKAAEGDGEAFEQEVARMAALGNSFHCPTVAALVDLWLWSRKVRTDPIGLDAILARWHDELREVNEEVLSPLMSGEDAGMRLSETEAEELALLPERRRFIPRWIVPEGDWRESERLKEASQKIVHHYLRRMEFRGSDVRLDLGVLFKPDMAPRTSIDPSRWVWSVAHTYPYKTREHINLLELRSILHALEWRARTATFHSCRFLHLSDSQICLAVLTKGRSSSRRINRILRRISALCLCLNLYPLWAWVESRLNPADEQSRRFENAKFK